MGPYLPNHPFVAPPPSDDGSDDDGLEVVDTGGLFLPLSQAKYSSARSPSAIFLVLCNLDLWAVGSAWGASIFWTVLYVQFFALRSSINLAYVIVGLVFMICLFFLSL